MENQSKLKTSKDIIIYLASQFPQCFSVEGEAKPLKIGIFQDIVARFGDDETLSKVKLRAALRTYTLSWRYLHSIKEGAARVDLDGAACGELTAEHVEHAKQQLKEGKDKLKAKRALEQKAARATNKENRFPNNAKSATDKKSDTDKVTKSTKRTKPLSENKPATTALKPVDVSTLKVGDEVNVNLSSKPVKAVLIAIEKENVRVKIPSGMELTVKPEYIVG